MLEFIFFHQNIASRFTDYLVEQEVVFRFEEEDENFTIAIPEDIDDDLLDGIEDEYDRLLDLSRQQSENEEGDNRNNYEKASLLLSLKDGSKSCAHVDTGVMNRMLREITHEELNRFIEAIVEAVETPDSRSYCQKINPKN